MVDRARRSTRARCAAIEKAIRDSDLGVNPTNDGAIIRVVFPQLTEERRKEFIKVAQHQGRGRQDLDPQRPPARQGRRSTSWSRTARPARTRSAAPRRSSRRSPRSTSRRSTSCSSTRKPSCSRSEARLPGLDPMTHRPRTDGSSPARARPDAGRCRRRSGAPGAGRNLPAAIGVGLGLGAVVLLVTLYLWKAAFVGVVVVGDGPRRLGADQRASAPDRIRVPAGPARGRRRRDPRRRPTPAAARPWSSRWR